MGFNTTVRPSKSDVVHRGFKPRNPARDEAGRISNLSRSSPLLAKAIRMITSCPGRPV